MSSPPRTKKNLDAAEGDCVKFEMSSVAACVSAEMRDQRSGSIWAKQVAVISWQARSDREAMLVRARRASKVASLSVVWSGVVNWFVVSVSVLVSSGPRREASGAMADDKERCCEVVLLKTREGSKGIRMRERAWLEVWWIAEERVTSMSVFGRILARRMMVSKSPRYC